MNMKIKYSPTVSLFGNKITYKFEGEKITCNFQGEEDEFDFSEFPEGVLDFDYINNTTRIDTILEINPIVSAKRENGVLWVELLNYIDEDATEEERFPEWFEVKSDGKD